MVRLMRTTKGQPVTKRLAAGVSLVTLSLSLLVAGRADAQKYPRPGRTPYDIFDRSRPDRDHIAPPPPVIPSAPAQPATVRAARPSPVAVTPGVPTREFKLPSDAPRRAPGYESAFDLNIVSSQLALNRGGLTPVRQTAGIVTSSIRRGSDTFYVIPGCYLGNLPPREVSLPSGCDIAKARTIK
jgi:hypothetical protein